MAQLYVASIKKSPDGKLQDGRGLILVKQGEAGRWVYRYSRFGRRREMGLGTWPQISLAEARKIRDTWATVLASGKDPIDVRDDEREAERLAKERSDPSMVEIVAMVLEAKKSTLRGEGTRGQWINLFEFYVFPAFGKKPISQITQRDLVTLLRPIWKTKHPTAIKLLTRIGVVLKSAKRMGFLSDPSIVQSAQEMLGHHTHVTVHRASVPWQDIPKLYRDLPDFSGGRCNRFMILTLVRLHGCIGAAVSEIDFDTATWTVPADRIKGRVGTVRDFRVPLSPPAMEFALEARRLGTGYLFPGYGKDKHISREAVGFVLRNDETPGSPHGYRTSFRTWVQETDACSWDVAEMVLGHRIGTTIQRSYARSDLLDQRREVLNKWADFVLGR